MMPIISIDPICPQFGQRSLVPIVVEGVVHPPFDPNQCHDPIAINAEINNIIHPYHHARVATMIKMSTLVKVVR